MRLLVSVSNAAEAIEAVAGGADIVDAKDPESGALGAVAPDVLREIEAAVNAERPVTAALGDACDEAAIERLADAFARCGAALVKIGFAGVSSSDRIGRLTAAAVRGARAAANGGVVAVAYADAGDPIGDPAMHRFVAAVARAGARGVLLDTADKTGPGLRALVRPAPLRDWVRHAREAGLLVALAGKLTADDLPFVQSAGADIAGVRGAACDGGRSGRVSRDRVARLRALTRPAPPAAPDADLRQVPSRAPVRSLRA
jgi:uncharacterized protein (UPF0264 family)